MANNKDNAYHVKMKLIPQNKGFKSSFVQGIVFEKTSALAEKLTLEKLNEWNEKQTDLKSDIKVHSIVKLRNDFLFTS